jgi:hypothetical protein
MVGENRCAEAVPRGGQRERERPRPAGRLQDDARGVLIARDAATVAEIESPYADALARFGDVFSIESDPPEPPKVSPGR